MLATVLYEDGDHRWIMFTRDPGKPDAINNTNHYLVQSGTEAILLDPGSIEMFAPMLSSVLKYVPADNITSMFASRQSPDISSSLGLWDQALPNASLFAPTLWEGFLKHFGMTNIHYKPIPDEGMTMTLGHTQLQFIPAHYLPSPANFHVWDAKAGILMSGDVGTAPEEPGSSHWVDSLDRHIPKMKKYHQRWMPSDAARQDWIRRAKAMDAKILAPQHGRLFKGPQVNEFLNWFEQLPVGVAVHS